MPVSAVRAVCALKEALDAVGLERTSGMSGGAITGWVDRNHYGSTGFSLRPRPDGRLDWHFIVSGKPHMRYRDFSMVQGDEVVTLHEPVNPEVVAPRIAKAFEALGLKATDIRCTGSQGMWDDDVDFEAVTPVPEWLEKYDPKNAAGEMHDGIRLLSATIEPMPMPSRLEIPVYAIGFRQYAVTREAAEALCAVVVNEKRYDGLEPGEARIEADGSLYVNRPGRAVDIRTMAARGKSPGVGAYVQPQTIVNHWGDEVVVWKIPKDWIEPQRRFNSDIPVTIAGEQVVRPSFTTLDAQYGDEAPWLPEAAAPGMKL